MVASFPAAAASLRAPSTSPLTTMDYEAKGLSGKLEEYLPPDQPTVKAPSFCQKDSLSWDTNGVPLPNKTGEGCYANNNSSLANAGGTTYRDRGGGARPAHPENVSPTFVADT